jgi:hypothetical protein
MLFSALNSSLLENHSLPRRSERGAMFHVSHKGKILPIHRFLETYLHANICTSYVNAHAVSRVTSEKEPLAAEFAICGLLISAGRVRRFLVT